MHWVALEMHALMHVIEEVQPPAAVTCCEHKERNMKTIKRPPKGPPKLDFLIYIPL